MKWAFLSQSHTTKAPKAAAANSDQTKDIRQKILTDSDCCVEHNQKQHDTVSNYLQLFAFVTILGTEHFALMFTRFYYINSN